MEFPAGFLHSGLMPADLVTLAHLSVWSAMNFPNSADVNDIGWKAQVDKARLHIGFGDDGIDLLVELFDNLSGCALRRADAELTPRLITRQELTHGRDARQRLQVRHTGYGEGS